MSEQQRICDSSDLPDNVGTVFITDVPGSWLQVIGRRAFGTLWVSGYAIQAKDAQDTPAVALSAEMPGIEVVRGPEAEQLIELVDVDRGEQIWRDFLAHGGAPAFSRSSAKARH
jgi:hypothetical protein